MGQISGYGMTATLASGWDGAIYTSDDIPPLMPNLHAASFTLPANDQQADFGDYAIDQLGNGGIFVALCEYFPDVVSYRGGIDPGAPGIFAGSMLQPTDTIYEPAGLPGPFSTADFDPQTMNTAAAANSPGGVQSFFRASGRVFAFYAVIGNEASGSQVAAVNNLINTLGISTNIQAFADVQIGFSPPPSFGPGGSSGNFLGHGSGTCAFSAHNGDFDDTMDCTVNVAGTYSGDGGCTDDFVLDGTYTLNLDDGRSLSASMELTVPGMNAQSTVAEFSWDGNDPSIPAACILNGGTCGSVTTLRVNLTGVFREARLA